jgi:hypothetical protein
MATPPYQGQNQPTATTGGSWLGQLGAYFGAPAPVYASAPTPAPADPTPSKPSSTAMQPAMICPIDPDAFAAGQIVIVVPRADGDGRIAIDPDALASGQIAIVVPREALTNRRDA